jgi:hypothetical protein
MFLTRVSPASLLDVSGGRIKMTRIRLIVGLISSDRTYLTITKTIKGRPRPDPGCSATDDDDDDDSTLWDFNAFHEFHTRLLSDE